MLLKGYCGTHADNESPNCTKRNCICSRGSKVSVAPLNQSFTDVLTQSITTRLKVGHSAALTYMETDLHRLTTSTETWLTSLKCYDHDQSG